MEAPRGAVTSTRAAIIEGQQVTVVERKPMLPRKLDDLLAAMIVTRAYRVRLRGFRRDCDVLREHPFVPLREGRFMGTEILVAICPYCEAVCVRDVGFDVIERGIVARGGPQRRDEIIGWYSGKRPAGREYK